MVEPKLSINDMKISAKILLDKLRREIYIDEKVERCGQLARGLEDAIAVVQQMQVDAYMRYLDEHR